jgi:uncharacterized membrane protein
MEPTALVEHIAKLGERERRVIAHLLQRRVITRDINQEFETESTVGQRLADRVAAFGGSWTFIFAFLGMMVVWMLFNSSQTRPFDPFPFILLNLILSCLAALQAPVIMMSQNRQSARDRLDAQHDYEVNLKAELDIERLHAKIDDLKEQQWLELIALQRRQVQLLEEIRGART